MKGIQRLAALLGIICLAACHSRLPVDQTLAFKSRDSIWKAFRDEYKLHLQVIAATRVYDDNSLQIVLTEPPPHVTRAQLKHQLKHYDFLMEEQKNFIGYDGWTKDLVLTFTGVDQDDSTKLVSKLSDYLFFTDYKAYAVPLPFPYHIDPYLPDIDHRIQVAELDKWLIQDAEEFYDTERPSNATTLSDALHSSMPGLLYSKNPGFVVWMLPAGSDISDQQVLIRKFCVDADLILGCIKGESGQLAIIGRERTDNVYQLPPLRTETIQMLASANKEQISQSYERFDLFSGKMGGGKDWAPIYLSDELINTEYGSLLNITDQMLKSWSMCGKVTYEKFDYNAPVHYPFYPDAMQAMNTASLTFNWNTKGAGYSVDQGDHEFFCLNRTGALPITYLPEDRTGMESTDNLDRIEKYAYNYYAGLDNKDLVRVVEYASIYQLFSKYGITASKLPPAPDVEDDSPTAKRSTDPSVHPLGNFYDTLIDRISAMNDETEKRIANDYYYRLLRSATTLDDVADVIDDKVQLQTQLITELDQLSIIVSSVKGNYDKFKDFVLNPRHHEDPDDADTTLANLSRFFVQTINKHHLEGYLLPENDLAVYKNAYAAAKADDPHTWIKTPSLVVSWSVDSVYLSGGHNLGAKVTRFEVSTEAKQGELKVEEDLNGEKKVLINSADIGKINTNVLREIELSADQKPYIDVADINSTVRERNSVIPDAIRTERGMGKNQVFIRETEEGFHINSKVVQHCDQLVEELTRAASDGSFDKLEVHFEGFTRGRAKAIIISSEIKYDEHPEWREQKILEDPGFHSMKATEYDFQHVRVISDLSNDIVIEIPAFEASARARVTLSSVAKNIRDAVLKVINDVLGRMGLRSSGDFYLELVNELKQFNIPASSVRLEKDDCIICYHPSNPCRSPVGFPPDNPGQLSIRPAIPDQKDRYVC